MISRARIIFKSASQPKAQNANASTSNPSQISHKTGVRSSSKSASKSHSSSNNNSTVAERATQPPNSHPLHAGSTLISSSTSCSSSSSASSALSSSVLSSESASSISSNNISAPSSCGAISSPGSASQHSDNDPYDGGSGADFHDENVWPDLDALLRDQISEIVHKWRQIDDEIWSKIVCFERNRRIAKAYARSQIISVTGSEQGFDGFRIGLNGFPNIKRDPETDRIKRQIQAGFKLKIDGTGNVFVKRVGPCPVYVGGANCVGIRSEPEVHSSPPSMSAFPSSYPSPALSSSVLSTPGSSSSSLVSPNSSLPASKHYNALLPDGHSSGQFYSPSSGYHVPASRFAPLEPNRAQQIFDMKHYQRAVSEFCQAKRPQAMLEQLHRGCLHAIQFGVVDDRTPARVLHHPCWIVLINIVALDLLWSRIGTADVPIGPHMHQRLMMLNDIDEEDNDNGHGRRARDSKGLPSSSLHTTALPYGNQRLAFDGSMNNSSRYSNKRSFDKRFINNANKHDREKSVNGVFGDGDTPARRNDARKKGVDDLYYSGYFAKISYQDKEHLQQRHRQQHSQKHSSKTNSGKSNKQTVTPTQTSVSQQKPQQSPSQSSSVSSVSEALSGTTQNPSIKADHRRSLWSVRSGNGNKMQPKTGTKQHQMCKLDFYHDDDDDEEELDDNSIDGDDHDPEQFRLSEQYHERSRPQYRHPLSKQHQQQNRSRRNSSSALFHADSGHTHFDDHNSHQQQQQQQLSAPQHHHLNRLQRYASCSALQHLESSNSSSYDEVCESVPHPDIVSRPPELESQQRQRQKSSRRNASSYRAQLHSRTLSTSLDHLHSSSAQHRSRHPYTSAANSFDVEYNLEDNPLYSTSGRSQQALAQDKLLNNQQSNDHSGSHPSKHHNHRHHHHHHHHHQQHAQASAQSKANVSGSYNLYPADPLRKLNSNGNSSATTDSSFVSSQSSLLSSRSSSSGSLSSLDDIPRRLSVSKYSRSSSCKNINSLKDNANYNFYNRKPKINSSSNNETDSSRTPTTSGCCRHRLYKTRAQSKALADSRFKSNLISARKQYSSNIELRSSRDTAGDYDEDNDSNNNDQRTNSNSGNNLKQLLQYQFHHHNRRNNNSQHSQSPNDEDHEHSKSDNQQSKEIDNNRKLDDDDADVGREDGSEDAKRNQKLAFNQRLGRLLLLQQHIQFQHNIQQQQKQQFQQCRDDELHL